MFGPNMTNTLTLTRVLGISKGLGILNQAIPLYKEIKPMIGSARKVMNALQDLKTVPNIIANEINKDSAKSDSKKTIDVIPKETQIVSQSVPVFFQ